MEFEEGPITSVLEAAATAVGVGMVLGGFVAGLAGLLRGTPRDELELHVLRYGYLGAAGSLGVRLLDLIII